MKKSTGYSADWRKRSRQLPELRQSNSITTPGTTAGLARYDPFPGNVTQTFSTDWSQAVGFILSTSDNYLSAIVKNNFTEVATISNKLMNYSRIKLLAGVIIFVSIMLVSYQLYRSWQKQNFVIESSLKPDTYIATKIDETVPPGKESLQGGITDGYGVVTHTDGSVYVGNFIEGKENGKGKITYPGGASYEGYFREGLPDGNGICTYSSGESVKCVFQLGQRQ